VLDADVGHPQLGRLAQAAAVSSWREPTIQMNSVGGIRANSTHGRGMRAAKMLSTVRMVSPSIQRSAVRRDSEIPAAAAAYTNRTAAPELSGVVTTPSTVTGMVNQRRVS
jgi:hypothetical protein